MDTCVRCKGKGFYHQYVGEAPWPCEECNGSGKAYMSQACTRCKGQGWIHPREIYPDYQPSYNYGSGDLDYTDRRTGLPMGDAPDCPECEGRGYVD